MKIVNAGVNPHCMESCHPNTGQFEDWIAVKNIPAGAGDASWQPYHD